MIYVVFTNYIHPTQKLSPIVGIQRESEGFISFWSPIYDDTAEKFEIFFPRRSYSQYKINFKGNLPKELDMIFEGIYRMSVNPEEDFIVCLSDVPRNSYNYIRDLASSIYYHDDINIVTCPIFVENTKIYPQTRSPIINSIIESGIYEDINCAINGTAIRLSALNKVGGYGNVYNVNDINNELFLKLSDKNLNKAKVINMILEFERIYY